MLNEPRYQKLKIGRLEGAPERVESHATPFADTMGTWRLHSPYVPTRPAHSLLDRKDEDIHRNVPAHVQGWFQEAVVVFSATTAPHTTRFGRHCVTSSTEKSDQRATGLVSVPCSITAAATATDTAVLVHARSGAQDSRTDEQRTHLLQTATCMDGCVLVAPTSLRLLRRTP